MKATSISSHTLSDHLTSKSNYQCIVEGKNSQLGLSYPEHLSTNLVSKRTSHSAAEKRRRDRLRNALWDMAKLLPQSSYVGGTYNNSPISSNVGEAGEINNIEDGSGGISQTNSKVHIVKTAI